jgi:uncharacterized membrane protein
MAGHFNGLANPGKASILKDMIDSSPRLWFNAVLHPQHSLGPRGFFVVMALFGTISFVAGMIFVQHGAWPVSGFFGLDAALLYGAFRLSARAGRLVETIQLYEKDLVVRRILPGGRVQSWRFTPYWVRVRTRPGGLVLGSHGREVTLGAFLAPGERASLAAALGEALAVQRAEIRGVRE